MAAAVSLAVPSTGLCAQTGEAVSPVATSPSRNDVAPLFASTEPLIITVQVDLRTLVRDKDEQKEDHRATLTYLDEAGATVSTPLKLRTRGNYRLKHCRFPPIRFDFPKDNVGGTVFAGQNKIKVVTHCDKNTDYEQNLLHEYAAYRVYNLLSDLSFRVRLARITYQDTEGNEDTITRYAFFIEHIDDLAARVGMIPTDTLNVHPAHTDFQHTGVLDVFQYFIGNTDWSTYARHNIELLRSPQQTLFAVPYDFDWAGIVDARYAKPNPRLGIRSVRDRLYRGFCRPPEYVDSALEPFRQQRDAIYAVIDSLPDLEPKRLERTRKFFDDFYKTIDDPGDLEREFLKKCRTQ